MFPRKLAEGQAFCNRKGLRERLAISIAQQEHTVIVSPRRYGKTSLVLKVLDEMQIPFVHVDLFLAVDEKRVVERFLAGVTQLLNALVSPTVKDVTVVSEFFKSFRLSLSIGKVGASIHFDAPRKSTEQTLLEAFEGLDALLEEQDQKAAFFIDEMQDILGLSVCPEIEYVIRSFAQKSRRIAFVFSGSNRRLLEKLFDDRSRPLWKLCARINLSRITESSYEPFLNQAAQERWEKTLSAPALAAIFEVTQCHPYYVNYLCSELWAAQELPDQEQVYNVWQQLCWVETASVAEMLSDVTNNQKRILILMAQKSLWFKPTSVESVGILKMSPRGVQQSLAGLLEKDFVEKVLDGGEEGYRVLDPLMKQVLLVP